MLFGLLSDIVHGFILSIGSLNLLGDIGWILYNCIEICLSKYKLYSIERSWFWYLKKDLLSCISNNVSWSQGPFINKYNNINLSIELQKYFSIIPLIALALSEK